MYNGGGGESLFYLAFNLFLSPHSLLFSPPPIGSNSLAQAGQELTV